MDVVPFTPDDASRWDELVARAPMATFLHTRGFLGYHGDRFEDASVLVIGKRGALAGVVPAALDTGDPSRVVSHPGATFGGLVHDGRLGGERAHDALAAVCAHYAERGLRALAYKPVPHIYQRSPSADDVWALAQLGAERVSCDISCAIDVAARREPSARRARSLATAERSGVEVADGAALRDVWPVLEAVLAERHDARPVHSIEEIELLRARFPEAIVPLAGRLDGRVVACAVLFVSPRVIRAQYLAADAAARRTDALDAVIERAVELTAAAGARYLDLGTSRGANGSPLSTGLYTYKAEFGGGGVIYEHYETSLTGA